MPKLSKIYEVLDAVENAKTTEERVKLLQENNSLALRDVLRAAFDSSIIFTLPAGLPSYQSSLSTEGMAPTDLTRCTNQFTYFVKGGRGDGLSPLKRESLFLRILEGVHPRDAEIVCLVKEKKLDTKFTALSKDLVKRVWPKLILT